MNMAYFFSLTVDQTIAAGHFSNLFRVASVRIILKNVCWKKNTSFIFEHEKTAKNQINLANFICLTNMLI